MHLLLTFAAMNVAMGSIESAIQGIATSLKAPLTAIGVLAFIISGIGMAFGVLDRRALIGSAAGLLIAFFASDLAGLLLGGG